jgi:hypothetical protein
MPRRRFSSIAASSAVFVGGAPLPPQQIFDRQRDSSNTEP